MLKKRMILCLLMRNDGVFCNSRNFSLQSVGELAWIRRYLDFSAIDELVLLNVDRQAKDVERFADHIRELGRLCFVPITAGGGVRTLNDFRTLLDSGADKIVVNSESVRHPDFITEAARTFGSQCVVVSIDVKKTPSGLRVFASNGASNTGIEPVSWAREMEARGAGEIFLTSIDRDGTGRGYDLDLLGVVSDAVSIPVIASGGVGEFQHLVDGFEQGNASAVSAANIFHYIGNGLVGAKQFMFDKGVAAPMWNFW
jgi:imidazole glycerol-phosphate synthase subunit HisF